MKFGTPYSQGDIVLVPFPFTDLSTTKRRPALIVSPTWFHKASEDAILAAITSQIPNRLTKYEILLEQDDLHKGTLPKRSLVKVTKLFTIQQALIVKRIGQLREDKLECILEKLRLFFIGSAY